MLISISSSDLDSGRRPIAISDEFSEISILVSEIRRCENKAFPKKRPTYWDFESEKARKPSHLPTAGRKGGRLRAQRSALGGAAGFDLTVCACPALCPRVTGRACACVRFRVRVRRARVRACSSGAVLSGCLSASTPKPTPSRHSYGDHQPWR